LIGAPVPEGKRQCASVHLKNTQNDHRLRPPRQSNVLRLHCHCRLPIGWGGSMKQPSLGVHRRPWLHQLPWLPLVLLATACIATACIATWLPHVLLATACIAGCLGYRMYCFLATACIATWLPHVLLHGYRMYCYMATACIARGFPLDCAVQVWPWP